MGTSLLASVLTFRKCTLEKLSFIALNLIDFCLTIFASSIGAYELNPLMRNIVHSPSQLYLVKLVFPVVFAWLLPGKFLIPSIAFLVLVVGWDIRELIIFFC